MHVFDQSRELPESGWVDKTAGRFSGVVDVSGLTDLSQMRFRFQTAPVTSTERPKHLARHPTVVIKLTASHAHFPAWHAIAGIRFGRSLGWQIFSGRDSSHPAQICHID